MKNISKRRIWRLGTVAACLTAAGGVQLATQRSGAAVSPRSERAAVQVMAQVLAPRPLVETFSAIGTLRADEAVELQAEASGRVVAIGFKEGAAVREGDLLMKINDADLQANLERALQRQGLAELREQRLRTLAESGSVNQQDYDAAASELRVQLAEVQLIRAQIAKTEVRAPFSGTVGLREVSVGAFVTPATRIATLQKLDGLKMDFAIPEKFLGRVRVGDVVGFRVSEIAKGYTAQVYAVEPKIDVATRTALLRARCVESDGGLLPGAFARIEVVLSRSDAALLVPGTSIVSSAGEKSVYLVERGVAVRRTVETGSREGGQVQVLSGLKAGDVVVTAGVQQLRPQMAVELIEAN